MTNFERLLGIALLTALVGSARAGALGESAVTMPAPYRPLAMGSNLGGFQFNPASQLRPLGHRWAVGLDAIPGLAPAGAMVAQPNAVSVRWWYSDRLGVDVSGTFASQAVSGSAASAGTLTAYGAALGLRYNVSEPSKDLMAQLVLKAAYADAAPDSAEEAYTQSGFVGLGFEAFIPGWEWLSVEGCAGASYSAQSSSAGPGPSHVGLGAGGYAPVALTAHVYF